MNDKELLAEELKRHMLIVEYAYEGALVEDDEDEDDDSDATDDFDFGDEDESEEGGLDDSDGDDEFDFGDEEGFGDDMVDEPLPEEPAEDEVEVDITQLIGDIEQNKNVANNANTKMDNLMAQFNQLQSSLKSMDAISQKITNMESEMEKRMPTPEDKLEMRSLDSYPYNLKLTDYWSDQEGKYDVMGDEPEGEKEYVLTHDDVNDEYSDRDVENSFDNDYEEDTITI